MNPAIKNQEARINFITESYITLVLSHNKSKTPALH